MIAPSYLQLLVQVTRDRAAGCLLVRLSWFLAVCIVGELAFGMYFGQPRFGYTLLIGLICGTGYLWCGAFLKTAVRQNHPVYASLVPQLRGRLIVLTAALFLACTVASTIVTTVLVGHAGYAFVGGGLFSVYLLFVQRYAVLNFVPSVLVVVSASLNNRPLQALAEAVEAIGEPAIAGAGVVLLLLLLRPALHAAFPQGGDRHWALHACQARQLARRNGIAPATGGSRWSAVFRLAYLATLSRDSRGGASQGTQGRQRNMMLHSLGTAAHDGTSIAYVLLSTVIMVLVGRHLAGQGEHGVAAVSITAMQACLMLSGLMYAVNAAASATRHGAEQSLYRLTPASPEAAQVNRLLLRALLGRCLRLWLITVVGAVCIDLATLGQLQLRGPVFALAMLMLPFSGLVMRNYAVLPARQSGTLAAVTTVLAILVFIAVLVVEQTQPEFAWFPVGGAIALATVIGLRWRWQQMMALPPLLPSGHLAR